MSHASCVRGESPESFDWNEIVDRYGASIRAVARKVYRSWGSRPRDEELAETEQEVYLRLVRLPSARAALEGAASEEQRRIYVRRVARTVCIDEARRRRAEKRGGHLLREPSIDFDRWPGRGPSPEARLLRVEAVRRVREVIDRAASLGNRRERDRTIFELSALHGLSCREIREWVDVDLSPSGIHTALTRMRRRLASLGREAVCGESSSAV